MPKKKFDNIYLKEALEEYDRQMASLPPSSPTIAIGFAEKDNGVGIAGATEEDLMDFLVYDDGKNFDEMIVDSFEEESEPEITSSTSTMSYSSFASSALSMSPSDSDGPTFHSLAPDIIHSSPISVSSPQSDNNYLSDASSPLVNDPSIRRRRRLLPHETDFLIKVFEQYPRPSPSLRDFLAGRLGMSGRGIQIWFQNRRAKVKRDWLESGKAMLLFSPHGIYGGGGGLVGGIGRHTLGMGIAPLGGVPVGISGAVSYGSSFMPYPPPPVNSVPISPHMHAIKPVPPPSTSLNSTQPILSDIPHPLEEIMYDPSNLIDTSSSDLKLSSSSSSDFDLCRFISCHTPPTSISNNDVHSSVNVHGRPATIALLSGSESLDINVSIDSLPCLQMNSFDSLEDVFDFTSPPNKEIFLDLSTPIEYPLDNPSIDPMLLLDGAAYNKINGVLKPSSVL